MNIRITFAIVLATLLASCSKETINEKHLGGIWEGKKVQYLIYDNQNNLVKDSTVDNSGALYLYDDEELYNQFRYSLAIAPATFINAEYWEGNAGDAHTLMGTNIRKLTRRKMELAEHLTDSVWNVQKTVIYYFERQ